MPVIPKNFVNESSINRVMSHGSKHDTGCITAFRGYRSYRANRSKNQELFDILVDDGWGIISVVGHYQEKQGETFLSPSSEQSYYVFDLKGRGDLKQRITELGRMFEQDSVYFKPAGGKGVLISTFEHNMGTETEPSAETAYGKLKRFRDNDFRAWTEVGGRPFADDIDASPIYS